MKNIDLEAIKAWLRRDWEKAVFGLVAFVMLLTVLRTTVVIKRWFEERPDEPVPRMNVEQLFPDSAFAFLNPAILPPIPIARDHAFLLKAGPRHTTPTAADLKVRLPELKVVVEATWPEPEPAPVEVAAPPEPVVPPVPVPEGGVNPFGAFDVIEEAIQKLQEEAPKEVVQTPVEKAEEPKPPGKIIEYKGNMKTMRGVRMAYLTIEEPGAGGDEEVLDEFEDPWASLLQGGGMGPGPPLPGPPGGMDRMMADAGAEPEPRGTDHLVKEGGKVDGLEIIVKQILDDAIIVQDTQGNEVVINFRTKAEVQ